MRKSLLILVLTFFFTAPAFSGTPYTEFKVGYLNPSDAKAGYIFGLNMGRMIDESVSWSFELNYFQKTFNKTTTVASEQDLQGNIIKTKQTEIDLTTRIIPLFLKLNFESPLGRRSPLYARGSAGIGWEFLWSKENNYLEKTFQTRYFNGFGWQVSGGLGFQISSSANLFADLFYNGSKVKRGEKKNELGYPTWQELNISGLGVRVGISIVGFGW